MIGIKKVRGDKPYYKNDPKNLLPLSEYYRRANKIIFTYSKKYPYIHKYDSDDLRGMVVEYMINGDLKYNPDKNMSLESYRYDNGIYGINSYINTINGSKNKIHNNHERFIYYDCSDKRKSNEEIIELRDYVEYILNCPELTDKQRNCLQLRYLEKMSINDISDELQVKKQAVQQLLKRAVHNLSEWVKTLNEI